MDISKLPFSQVRIVGNTVFFSGQIGLSCGKIVDGGVAEELRQIFRNIDGIIAGNQLNWKSFDVRDLFDVTVLLASMEDYATMNNVYAEELVQRGFGTERCPFPVRTAFAVGALPFGARIELKCVFEAHTVI